jgi:hypothetical protein
MKLEGGGKRKENDRKSTIWRYITLMQVEDITILKAVKQLRVVGRVKESNRGGQTDQSKACYSLDGETPLNIDFGINNERQYCKIGTVSREYLWDRGG